MKDNRMKKYFLFLDESGTFDEDPNQPEAECSLVGGVFCTPELESRVIGEQLLEEVRSGYQEEIDSAVALGEPGLDATFHHATQLPRRIKAQAKVSVLEKIIERGYIPVVFQQSRKVNIQNNTTTYLMFLTDGIIKIAQQFSRDSGLDLTVVIGGRRDMTYEQNLRKKGEIPLKPRYISYNEIAGEFDKFMQMAKIRQAYAFQNEVRVHLRIGNDKEDSLLVLSDYVCNTYYTRNGVNFLRNKELRERLDKCLKKYRYFSIIEEPAVERLKRYLDDGNVGEALFFFMLLDDKSHELNNIMDLMRVYLSRMNDTAAHSELMVFCNKLDRLIRTERACEKAVDLITKTIRFIGQGYVSGQVADEFLANLYLYKMAALTHLGRIKQYMAAEAKCAPYIKKVGNPALYFHFQNRRIVDLQDHFMYEASLSCGRETLEVLKLFQGPEKECERRTGYAFRVCGDQYAKICGSLAMTVYFMLNKSPERLPEARMYSDAALHSFETAADIARQQQIRAEIEAETGHFQEARKWLETALGVDLETVADKEAGRFNNFEWYHFSHVLQRMADGADASIRKTGLEAVKRVLSAFEKYAANCERPLGHPDIITFYMMGQLVFLLQYKLKAYKFIKEALDGADQLSANSPVFLAMSLIIRAGLLRIKCMDEECKGLEPELAVLHDVLKRYVTNERIPESMLHVFKTWDASLKRLQEAKRTEQGEIMRKLSNTLLF